MGNWASVVWFHSFFCLCHLKISQDDLTLLLNDEFAVPKFFFFTFGILCLYMVLLGTHISICDQNTHLNHYLMFGCLEKVDKVLNFAVRIIPACKK